VNKLTLRMNDNPYALDKVFDLQTQINFSYAVTDKVLAEDGHRVALAKMLKMLLRELVEQFDEQVAQLEKEKLCTK